jgi:hypothetical protein
MSSDNPGHSQPPPAASLCPSHRRGAGPESCSRCGSFLCAACLMESGGELRCASCLEDYSPPVDAFIPGESVVSRWGGRGLGIGALGGAALSGVLWTIYGSSESLIPIFVGPLVGALGAVLYASISKSACPGASHLAQAAERRERKTAAVAAFLKEELVILQETLDSARPCTEHPERESWRVCPSCRRAACDECLTKIEEISRCWACRPPAPPKFRNQQPSNLKASRLGHRRAMVALLTVISLPFILVLASIVLPPSLSNIVIASRPLTILASLGLAIALFSAKINPKH